jgi:lipopolysaccharide export system protein LptA
MNSPPARLLLLALLVVAPGVRALESDAQQPIDIRARSVEANEKTGVSVYRGDVVMTQGSLRIEADRLEVTLRAGRVQLVRGWGEPARVRSRTDAGEELRGRGRRLEYRAQPRELDLYGDVELRRDGDVLTGAEAVHYSFAHRTFVARGGAESQVHAVIQPAPPAAGQ